MKRSCVIGLAVLILGAACVPTIRSMLWPRYGGRSLNAWLHALYDYETPGTQERAANAIEQIGTNAVSYLIRMLPYTAPSPIQLKYRDLLRRQTLIKVKDTRLITPRQYALAGLDALGSNGKAALPELQKLLSEDPPDNGVLYVIARIGQAGVPLLTMPIANESRALKIHRKVLLNMLKSNSPTLNPYTGAEYQKYERRICELRSWVKHTRNTESNTRTKAQRRH